VPPELPALPPPPPPPPPPLLLLEEPQAVARAAIERTATVATVFRVSFRTSTDLPIYRSSRYMTSADASTATTTPSTTASKPHVTNLPTRPAFTARVPVAAFVEKDDKDRFATSSFDGRLGVVMDPAVFDPRAGTFHGPVSGQSDLEPAKSSPAPAAIPTARSPGARRRPAGVPRPPACRGGPRASLRRPGGGPRVRPPRRRREGRPRSACLCRERR
jgi:hypothetical protein